MLSWWIINTKNISTSWDIFLPEEYGHQYPPKQLPRFFMNFYLKNVKSIVFAFCKGGLLYLGDFLKAVFEYYFLRIKKLIGEKNTNLLYEFIKNRKDWISQKTRECILQITRNKEFPELYYVEVITGLLYKHNYEFRVKGVVIIFHIFSEISKELDPNVSIIVGDEKIATLDWWSSSIPPLRIIREKLAQEEKPYIIYEKVPLWLNSWQSLLAIIVIAKPISKARP